jgi:hypothetical protein
MPGPTEDDATKTTSQAPGRSKVATAFRADAAGLIEAGVLLVVGVAAMLDSIRLITTTPARDLTGPGRYLLLVSGLLIITAGVYARLQFRPSDASVAAPETETGTSTKTVVVCFIAFAVYLFLIQHVGYFVSTLIFTAFILRTLGGSSWIGLLVMPPVATLGLYLIFVEVAGMVFPRNTWLF